MLKEVMAENCGLCPIFLTSTYFTKRVHIKCRGCPTLWGCSMVCIGRNIAVCSTNPQFLPVMCALCRNARKSAIFVLWTKHPSGGWFSGVLQESLLTMHCARTVQKHPPKHGQKGVQEESIFHEVILGPLWCDHGNVFLVPY